MLISALILVAQASASAPVQQPFEINTVLMESTFYLEGPSAKEHDKVAIGSGMVVLRPCGANAPDRAAYVLVTAAHVLNEISGDTLRLVVRTKEPDGTWQKK
jgi:hypothetical protein